MNNGVNKDWVVLELGPKADGEDPDIIRASIRHSIRDAEVFIPASVTKMGDDRVIQYLVEGYAFVRRKHPDETYLRLENTKYVDRVLRHLVTVGGPRSIKQIAVVPNDEIEKLRRQVRIEVDQGISVGDLVMITSGPYRQITARVENEILEQDSVQVFIKLRSKEAIITLPRACLRLVQKSTKAPLQTRFNLIREWFKSVPRSVKWSDGIERVLVPYQTYLRLNRWMVEGKSAYLGLLEARNPTLFDFEPLERKCVEYTRISIWFSKARNLYVLTQEPPTLEPLLTKVESWELLSRRLYGKSLYERLRKVYTPLSFPNLDTAYLNWAWFETVGERLDALQVSIDTFEHILRSGGKVGMLQNLIIDGTQLAIRCALSPGLGELRDSKGRPTGAIVGFCNSLVSLKKRYPTATLHVTWDGSSQRRRKMFAGYKASRSSHHTTFEIQHLKTLLPKLGVNQTYNPEEEADDVIATLVHRKLKGQLNSFLTTDRDLLQLVSDTNTQIVPAVGASKERLYTVEEVVEEYGVGPELLVHVRALSGDTSDEIPGVEGFGLKTATKLIKLYGSVDRLFTSNLAGLSSKQSKSLRASEQQVRLNLELLKLQDDLALTHVGPDPDQIAATERLREVDIKPDSILVAFFHNASGLTAHT
jgi:5'-3' exonuclease/transcription antitermination factor NusG